jgi:predicted ArsR family transcriptional regulator
MDAETTAREKALAAVGALEDGLRRGMYGFVRRAGRPVTRDEAAASVGISRKLAAFHLDKLVDVGLLRTRYDAPGRPRAVGRAPKLYEPTDTQFTLTIPERRHDLLARLLLDGVLENTPGQSPALSAIEAAGAHGRSLGRDERERTRPGRLGPERAMTACEHILETHGYEPEREALTRIRLRNCPFHPLAAEHPGLVCALNQAFLAGCLDGLDATGLEAQLAPHPGQCCVILTTADTASPVSSPGPQPGEGQGLESGVRPARASGVDANDGGDHGG